jgi:transcriptional regulator with XRE-family HTH domain
MAATPARINVPALYAALDAQREAAGLSWRQLAKDRGLSPSTFTRLASGHRPDVDAFAALVGWLGQPAERFIISDGRDAADEPALLAELAPLLRARADLDETDADRLQSLFAAAIAQFQAERAQG